MIVEVYGFDWATYMEKVMPAFARWLVDGAESAAYQLYQQTRCAQEEQYIPPMLRPVRTWTRAVEFVQRLPQGIHTSEEYRVLCDADQFTALSDQYIHRHPPQLYPHAEALRAVWGAIVEAHCQNAMGERQEDERGQGDGGGILADQKHRVDYPGNTPRFVLGRQPANLHMRGWLAARSVRAMALFELLACGRRCLPFGSRAGEPYEDYVGYLTPGEVWQMECCLCNEDAVLPEDARHDSANFRLIPAQREQGFRMIDEVLPVHATTLLQAVRLAARDQLGLLCRIS